MKKLIAVWLAVLLTAVAVNAFNLSPYTFKLRSKLTSADSVSIYGGSLHAEHVDSVIVVTMRAGDKVITDTIQGAGSVVGIVDDTLRLDTDSTGAYAIITFGGWGGGIRWSRSANEMQYTNDFSTWTAIGTGGSSTTNADSLFHIPAFVRPQTDGYVLKFDADGDSLYLSADATGAAGDSNAITYETDRLASYSDSAMYFGDIGDSTVLRILGASTTSNADDTIMSFCKIYYGEAVVDSALVTYGTLEAAVAALGSGDITGVITTEPLTGGASTGDVNIGLDWTWLWGFNDTMTARVALASCSDSTIAHTGNAVIRASNGAIYIDAPSPANGAIFMQVGGAGQLLIDTGSVEFGRRLTMNSDTIQDFTGTGLTAAGKVLALSIPFLYGYVDTTTAKIPTATLADSTNGGAIRSEVTKTVAHPWLYAYIDTSRARIPASDTAYAVLHSWLYGYIDTSTATIPRATLSDSTSGGAARAEVAKTVIVNSIDSTHIKPNSILKSELAIESVDSTKIIASSVLSPEIADGSIALADYGANSIDSTKIMPSSVLKSELAIESVDSTKIIASSVLSPEIADGAIALADYGANSIDSTKIMPSSIKASELTVNVVDSTHLTANSVLASEIATGAVATAEILDRTVAAIDIDTSATIKANKFNGNWLTAWPDSTLNLGSGAGLTITSSILLGTEITDDTTVVDFYPEPSNVVLANSLMPQYNDSIKIYGVIDSLLGNTLHFRDSTLNTHGLRRRGFQMTVSHPMRVDSLRYVIIEGLVKDSSASNEMYLKGMLRTTTFTTSCLDSNAAANIKDYDSLGGDWGDVAAIRRFVLTGGAVTPGTPWYLLITARHDSGTAWNWAEVWRIRFVYSRTAV